jgi:ribosomal peptide maturation radical SAM protein 1
VALPWSLYTRPSAAIGSLKAYLNRSNANAEVSAQYEYVNLARQIGLDLYNHISSKAYDLGEVLYAPLLYREQRDSCISFAAEKLQNIVQPRMFSKLFDGQDTAGLSWTEMVDELSSALEDHVDEYSRRIATNYEIFGFTTCFGQLFANLAVAKRVKQINPRAVILLGGSTVSGPVGPSLLKEYGFLDYIIQGEGEHPLYQLISQLIAGEYPLQGIKGVLSRHSQTDTEAQLNETPRLDELPVPNFDEYASMARYLGIDWQLPIEGSRGCWWDRSKASKNPSKTCFFCNLNVQWNGYREKTLDRLINEIIVQSDRYQQTALFFLDNIIRLKGIPELASHLRKLGRDFSIFYEARANISPSELVEMWSAGLDAVQLGIEGLDTLYLRKLGKGTTTIQNLQAMKTCYELGIHNGANLIVGFPGGTSEEALRTADTIRRYAYGYTPLACVEFWLGVGSTVQRVPERFGITEIKNAHFYKVAVPTDVFERVQFFDLSHNAPQAGDWRPVYSAVDWWKTLHEPKSIPERPTYYLDGQTFVSIHYLLNGVKKVLKLSGIKRELFMYCHQIRTEEEIYAQFATALPKEDLKTLLEAFVREDLIFREGYRFLTIAPARTAQMAAKRIMGVSVELPQPPPKLNQPMNLE